MGKLQIGGVVAGTLALLGAATAAGVDRSLENDRTATEVAALERMLDPAQSNRLICGATGHDAKRAYTRDGKVIMAAAVGVATAASGAHPSTGQPLWTGYGLYGIGITTVHDKAQRYFDQGLRFAYAFNHAEAVRAFRTAQAIDPACAMCYWGEALALGPNINAPMDPKAVAPAFAAIARAQVLAKTATAKEQALIAALAKRYDARPDSNRAGLDKAYADEMRKVAAAYPNDDEVQALFAESLMDLQPWDYWAADGRTGKGNTDEIIATIERVLKRTPKHAAASHLYIHMVEASSTPERAKPFADRLAAQMPASGHIVHMPSHIYYRLGLWRESIAANIAAVKADEAYLSQVDAKGIYPSGYYPHNIHFVVTSAQMGGDAKTAVAYADKLARTASVEIAQAIPWVEAVIAAPYYAHVMFSTPERILAIPAPDASLRFAIAMWHYGRAEAHVAKGDLAAADQEAAAMRTAIDATAAEKLTAGGLPAATVVEVAANVLAGRKAMKRHAYAEAVAAFQAAVDAQDKLPYMEPPFWYYPVRQSLGAALVRAGRPADAVQVFRAALRDAPNSGWAIYGLMQAYRATGDENAATAAGNLFARTWIGTGTTPDLARM